MAKKKPIPPGELPDPENVDKELSELSTNPYLEAARKGEALRKRGTRRKDYESEKGRKRYNTMIHPDLKQLLQDIAKGQGRSVPDLIEELICKQLGIKPPSEP